MANCAHCGAETPAGAAACLKCGQPTAATPAASTSGLAIASLVFGILALLCFVPAAIVAIVLGYMARARIRRGAGTLRGEGLARAGMNMGVIGLILFVIAAIAIPNLIRSRISPGESSSVSGMRTINTAAITYTSTYPKIGFPPTLAALGSGGTDCHEPNEQHACLIDDVLASGRKSGYIYRYSPGRIEKGVRVTYTVQADPSVEPKNWLERIFGAPPPISTRHFFSDESAVIRSESDRPATAQSPPI